MAIGRFMSIDPLTEEYETWSPYAFSGNRVIDSRELEGLEPAPVNKKDDIQPGSFKYAVGMFVLNMINAVGSLGATVDGEKSGTFEQNLSHVKSGGLFIIDNSLFIEGVMEINRAPSDGEFSPNYAKGTTEAATKAETGLIYKVPGEATESGKPYIGRTKEASPAERGRGATDGRDRTKATVIDRYNAKDVKEGRYKEQRAINNNGGVKNLDNKRNEISPKKQPEYEKKYGKNGG